MGSSSMHLLCNNEKGCVSMDKSLLDAYSELDNSYYNIDIYARDLFNGTPKEELINCRNFIKEHFDKGNKQEALCIPWNDEYNKTDKHTHTVSLYLLGLLYESELGVKLENILKKLIPIEGDWYEYKYTWFLTCLYHDVASCIEHSALPKFPNDAQKQLSYYIGDLNIQYTPYSHSTLKPGVSLTRFSESLIHNYFRYRAESLVFDHGIVGGYYLFDRLFKNFTDKTSTHNWKTAPVCLRHGLMWRLEHLDHFAYISDAIICHNLWTAKKGEDLKYIAFGLSPLIVKGREGKLKFNQYPLQFLLCLLDSIEPVKRFGALSSKEVLQKISIQLRPMDVDKYIFRISWDRSLEDQKEFDDWKKNIIDIGNWMDVTIKKTKCPIEISFS